MSPTHRPGPVALTVECDDARLAGSLWVPDHEPRAVVLMWPGSGPSDRHNDVYFPPIRDHFLSLGLAVCSFDKRGVGDSTGAWQTAGIDRQADDALAIVDHLASEVPGIPIGFFGHSQGGWVVVDAAARRPNAAFVVSNAGPGVSPAAQERHATLTRLADHARDTAEFAAAARCFELALACLSARVPFDSFGRYVERAGLSDVYAQPVLFSFPIDDPDVWPFASLIIDHDPRPALRAMAVPTLALFGAADPIVPVDASTVAFESCVAPEVLTVVVLPGGDHRLQRDEQFVGGYFGALTAFVDGAVAR